MTTPTSPTRVRYLVLLLVGLAPAAAYLTRIISAFATTLETELHISNTAVGEIIAAFALGYFLFQIPGGILANAYGVRIVLPVMGIAWSLCAIWGSMARSAEMLQASRVVMGIAQAGLVPCCAKVAADWFPVSRRGLVSAVLTGSMQVGAVIATGLSSELLESTGWRNLLLGYGAVAIVWSAAFFLWFRNRPEEHARTNEEERALIRAGRSRAQTQPASSSPGYRRHLSLTMCLSVTVWAYCIQALFRAYSYEFFTSWFPAFLEKGFVLSKPRAGELATWPIVGYTIGSLLGGVVLDWVLVWTGSRWLSRTGTAILGLGVCASCFALATVHHDPLFVVVVLSVGSFFAAIAGPATWAAGMDIGGRHTAVLFAVMNTVGNVGSYLCPLHVGMLFDHIEGGSGSWDLVLWLFVGINVTGAAFWLLIRPAASEPEG